MGRLIDTIRAKHPTMALRARKSRGPAIRLFCLECMGDLYVEVKTCTAHKCPLHPWRLGAGGPKL